MSGFDEDGNRWDDRDEIWVEIDVDRVIHETDLAIQVRIGSDRIWLPKSQMEDWPELDNSGTVILKRWIAEEKELI